VCQQWAMIFDGQWKNMEIMAGTILLVFCNVYNARTFFRNLQTSYLTCKDRGILQTGYSLWPRSGCSNYNVATPN